MLDQDKSPQTSIRMPLHLPEASSTRRMTVVFRPSQQTLIHLGNNRLDGFSCSLAAGDRVNLRMAGLIASGSTKKCVTTF
jgi:hypothetical protein